MGVRISVFAPKLCSTLVSGLDEYADGCLFKKEQIGTLFVRMGALEGGLGGGWSLRGVHRAFQKNFLLHCIENREHAKNNLF
jgi:hypothetical protein